MFYLMMHSAHFVLQLCGVKDHSDSDRGNKLLPLHWQLFLISIKGSFNKPLINIFLMWIKTCCKKQNEAVH